MAKKNKHKQNLHNIVNMTMDVDEKVKKNKKKIFFLTHVKMQVSVEGQNHLFQKWEQSDCTLFVCALLHNNKDIKLVPWQVHFFCFPPKSVEPIKEEETKVDAPCEEKIVAQAQEIKLEISSAVTPIEKKQKQNGKKIRKNKNRKIYEKRCESKWKDFQTFCEFEMDKEIISLQLPLLKCDFLISDSFLSSLTTLIYTDLLITRIYKQIFSFVIRI